MSLFITSLNSGSNGNCYYIGNTTEAILVDAGISHSQIEKRMKRLGLCMGKVKALFVSHEHSDHIKGICGLVEKYRLPVYITSPTLLACGIAIDKNLVKSFEEGSPVSIGELVVTPFKKVHDACDPYSFVITCKGTKVGVFTDIGTPCHNVVRYFKQCHAAFLEANFDEDMLRQGGYPYFLKRRICGGNGHLSNTQALELFKTHRSSAMSHLFLAHLSKNNNCPQLVQRLFQEHAGGVKVIVAPRCEETPVYLIQPEAVAPSLKPHPLFSVQLSLSFQ